MEFSEVLTWIVAASSVAANVFDHSSEGSKIGKLIGALAMNYKAIQDEKEGKAYVR